MTIKYGEAWLSMADQKLTEEERVLDAKELPLDSHEQRNRQLRTQRRRAIRRALSLERLVRQFLQVAEKGSAEDIQKVFDEAARIVNIPLHEAILSQQEKCDECPMAIRQS